MNNNELLSRSVRISEKVKRNIVYLTPPENAYDELLESDDDLELLDKVVSNGKSHLMAGNKNSDFYYTCAVEYPFVNEPYIASQYSDGSFPVWYGSKKEETTIYETVFHTKKYLSAIEGIEQEDSVVRKRSIFNTHCDTLLIDVSKNKKYMNKLVSEDYSFCQQLAKQLSDLEFSGVLSPSARHKGVGVNVNIFSKNVLSEPELLKVVDYKYIPSSDKIVVYEQNGMELLTHQ